jgi:hypothetical protein
MRWPSALVASVSFALVLSCGGSPITNPNLEQSFTLRPGGSASLATEVVEVGFARVSSDSRCPTEARCIWEGVATVEVWAAVGRGPRTLLTLDSSDMQGYARERAHAGYRFRLVHLEPPQSLASPIRADQYVLTLLVTRES